MNSTELYTIRTPGTEAERMACGRLCQQVFGGSDPPHIRPEHVQSSASCVVGVFDGDAVIGTGRVESNGSTWFISSVGVDPDFREGGIGSQIIGELERYAAQYGASYTELSAAPLAKSLYKRLGYKRRYPSDHSSKLVYKNL